MREKRILLVLTVGIFLLAAFFRLYGLNWDQGQHLHPDERFLTMVATDITWPKDLGEYLDTDISPLNPHNRGFGFFVYGTFPVFFTKWVAESLGQGDYGNLTIIGRDLSAFVDLGTVLLVFLIGKQILKSTNSQINKFSNKNPPKLLDYLKLDNLIIGLFAAFIYAASVLPIQLSHFYAVDTYLTFFITLSFYMGIKLFLSANLAMQVENKILNIKYKIYNVNIKNLIYIFSLGISFGLALSSKISALIFLPIIFAILLLKSTNAVQTLKNQKIFNFLYVFFIFSILFFISTYLTFRLAQPYVFANRNIFDIALNPKILENWKQLEGFMKPDSGFPPSVQWFGITPFLFPLASLVLWGLGFPLGIISILAVMYFIGLLVYWFIGLLKSKQLSIINYQLSICLSLLWILLLFLYQASQPAPTIRYFLPIYPFLAIISGYFIVQFFNKFKIGLYLLVFIGVLVLIYPFAFLSIYSRPHSRVASSEWIYSHIPYGSTIATEHWDDGLPLTLDDHRISQLYNFVSLPLYDPDKVEKWPKIAKFLTESDYIILSSNRLWGSITKAPKLFPQTSKYYKHLFDGSLGFDKIAEITSFPSIIFPLFNNCLYIFPPQEERLGLKTDKAGLIRLDRCNLYDGGNYQGIVIRNEISEETFTVYDHPKVLIFKKVKPVDYVALLDNRNYKN